MQVKIDLDKKPIDSPGRIDDSSSISEENERMLTVSQNHIPNNKITFTWDRLTFDSYFPSGNLESAQCKPCRDNKEILYIQFSGNSDVKGDIRDKCWFYFSISGFDKKQYKFLSFKWKNANSYRKFVRQRKNRPYVLIREQSNSQTRDWRAIFIDKFNILPNQTIEAQFCLNIMPDTSKIYLAANLPYTMNDLQKLHQKISESLLSRGKFVYYHRQLTISSVEQFPVYLCTITSSNNIASYEERQIDIWPKQGQRPHKLKNRPEIIITARVHPSQVPSSWFIQGLMESLINNPEFNILLELFVFRIFPLINPDGVQNGNYRLDNYLQNLNRFYGYSQPEKNPSTFIIQNLIEKLRQKSKLFMYLDIHGHNSPKPSFIYGNYSTNIFQSIQNRAFCRILQNNNEGTFDYGFCQFSKKNMAVKQKYDEHSKQASGRVFAYRGDSQQDNLQTNMRNYFFVEHSYTYEVWPYVIPKKCLKKQSKFQNSNSFRAINPKALLNLQKSQNIIVEPTYEQILECYFRQGQNTLYSILQLVGLDSRKYSQIDNQESLNFRRATYRELLKSPDYFISDRNKRVMAKQIDKQMIQKYCLKWNLLEIFQDYLNKNLQIKYKSDKCLLYVLLKNKKQEKDCRINKALSRNSNKNDSGQLELPVGKISIKNQNEWQEQNYQQNYAIVSYPKSNLAKSNQGKSPGRINRLKSIEFQGIKEQFITKNSVKNSKKGCNSSNKKRNDQLDIQQKIRKLIFRHKTDNQILEYRGQDQYYPARLETDVSQFKNLHSNKNYRNTKTQKKLMYQVFELKKTENHTPNQQVFNDLRICDQMDQERDVGYQMRTEKSPKTGKQRIEDMIRRISIQKQRQYETIIHNNEELLQYKKIKSSNIIMKKAQKNQQQKQAKIREQKRTIGQPIEYYKQYMQIQSSTLLPSVLNHEDIQSLHSQKYVGRNRFQGITRIKSKNKIKPVFEKPKQHNFNDIVNSVRALGANCSSRGQFLSKAKKMFQERKSNRQVLDPKAYKDLPIIREIQRGFKDSKR